MLSFKEIKELIDLVAEKNLSGVEIERAGFRLRIDGHRGENGSAPVYYPTLPEVRVTGALAGAIPPPAAAPAAEEPPEAADEALHHIVSPIVGTFYRAASPESEPFVSPGDRVEKNRILCIIEAMKLMNEIESDVAGEIVKVFPQNGQPVEYGERLFAIKT
ncbi:MAG TPA: acetyl-CoA carboxylase biotin carboxyl carrier protein [Thermoanaerobaculia bacterium]|nr:acetyl-CoA carboxylase biotin carboxyl carrier protein [Thermoanaerobaculia bacterium]